MFSRRDVQKALRKKGFGEPENRDHICYFYPDSTVYTKVSHSGEIGIPLARKMAVQMRLSLDEFKKFVQCTITAEQYRQILIQKDELIP